jgi:mobilization protein NikA
MLTLFYSCGTLTLPMARPFKPANERLSVFMRLRFTKADYAAIRNAAKKAGLKVSEYARRKLLGRLP